MGSLKGNLVLPSYNHIYCTLKKTNKLTSCLQLCFLPSTVRMVPLADRVLETSHYFTPGCPQLVAHIQFPIQSTPKTCCCHLVFFGVQCRKMLAARGWSQLSKTLNVKIFYSLSTTAYAHGHPSCSTPSQPLYFALAFNKLQRSCTNPLPQTPVQTKVFQCGASDCRFLNIITVDVITCCQCECL